LGNHNKTSVSNFSKVIIQKSSVAINGCFSEKTRVLEAGKAVTILNTALKS
jgi:hypothetical protein